MSAVDSRTTTLNKRGGDNVALSFNLIRMLGFYIRNIRERFRFWLRGKTRSMSVAEAEEKRLFWAKIYALSGLMTLFYSTYLAMTDESRNFVGTVYRLPNQSEVKYIKFEGLKKADKIPQHIIDTIPQSTLGRDVPVIVNKPSSNVD